jgi:hypothetical protein
MAEIHGTRQEYDYRGFGIIVAADGTGFLATVTLEGSCLPTPNPITGESTAEALAKARDLIDRTFENFSPDQA